MSDTSPAPWPTRLVTFFLAALAAASTGFWVLAWPMPSYPAKALALEAAPVAIDVTKVAALLGAAPTYAATGPSSPALSLSSRFKLVGVIAPSNPRQQGTQGSALIAVDGAHAKPYRVGQLVADELALQSVQARRVALGPPGQSQATVTLELPATPGVKRP